MYGMLRVSLACTTDLEVLYQFKAPSSTVNHLRFHDEPNLRCSLFILRSHPHITTGVFEPDGVCAPSSLSHDCSMPNVDSGCAPVNALARFIMMASLEALFTLPILPTFDECSSDAHPMIPEANKTASFLIALQHSTDKKPGPSTLLYSIVFLGIVENWRSQDSA